MRLFSFTTDDNQVNIGIETEEEMFNLTRAFNIFQKAKRIQPATSFTFLQVLVEMEYCSSSAVKQIMSDTWVQAKKESLRLTDPVHYNLPIARPTKIIAMGRNYLAHIKELKHAVPKEPIFFCKAPSSLIPHEADIVIPHWFEGRVDHEAELGIIIGKAGKNIHPDNAMSHIAGYTIVNDVTARSMQKTDLENQNPWFRSKSFDTFCPTGPFLIPVDEIEDPHSLDIRLTVNGEEKQNANTELMIFKIPEIITSISKIMTLQPGDIIATGTPEGVSPIKEGDVVEITITHLGTLKNKVIMA